MNKTSSKFEKYNNLIISMTIAALVVLGTFVVLRHQERKNARREIAKNEFKLRDNMDARRKYIATAPEVAQNAHLNKIIDSLTTVNNGFVKTSDKYIKNQRLIARLDKMVQYNDSIFQHKLAQFDTVNNCLNREIRQAKEKLK